MTDAGVSRFPSLEYLFYLLSILYGGGMKVRGACYQKGFFKSRTLPCMVISVGNITVGGTGKTPMALYICRLVQRLGYRVAVVSRGYKGNAEKKGGVVSNGQSVLMGPEDAGDEPFMMATQLEKIPVLVGQDRFAAGMLAIEAFHPDVIVLDDAFQHLRMDRDLDFVLLDNHSPFGNSHLIPRGTLREPLSALFRADAFILTRLDPADTAAFDQVKIMAEDRPVFRSCHLPGISRVIRGKTDAPRAASGQLKPYTLESLKQYRVFAFSGVAQNDDFKSSLIRLGLDVRGFSGFPDHYFYSDEELEMIFNAAKGVNSEVIITTGKDFVRIADRIQWPLDVVVLNIETSFGHDTDAFHHFMESRLAGSGKLKPRGE